MASSSSNSTHHFVKQIAFNGNTCSIVTQNENGPCALLGLANVLILRSSMSISSTLSSSVSNGDLLKRVSDLLLSSASDNSTSADTHASKLNSALEFLAYLPWEMEVNVMFTGVTAFSPSPGTDLFSLLGVPLFHTWLVDPSSEDLASVIGDLSYVELNDKVITYKASGEQAKNNEANIAKDFLEMGPHQMVTYGLNQLSHKMDEGQLGVLFRNNHFATIYKKDGIIYQLVTDEGYLSRQDIVWETVVADGASNFVNSHLIMEESPVTTYKYRTRLSTNKHRKSKATPKQRISNVNQEPGSPIIGTPPSYPNLNVSTPRDEDDYRNHEIFTSSPFKVASSQMPLPGKEIFWNYDTPKGKKLREKMTAEASPVPSKKMSMPRQRLQIAKSRREQPVVSTEESERCREVFDEFSALCKPINTSTVEETGIVAGHVKSHREAVHKGVHPCKKCAYKATQLSHLKSHVKAVHEGVKYLCKKCAYEATQLSHLKSHVKGVHEGVKYPCKKCAYKATQLSNLERHVKAVHEGVKYPCKKCAYEATRLSSLKRHIKSIHKGDSLHEGV